MSKRTVEEIIKFDSGITVGQHCVTVTNQAVSEFIAIVDISPRGVVNLIKKPNDGDMYTCWYRVKGNDLIAGKIIVWGEHNAEIKEMFSNPIQTVKL